MDNDIRIQETAPGHYECRPKLRVRPGDCARVSPLFDALLEAAMSDPRVAEGNSDQGVNG